MTAVSQNRWKAVAQGVISCSTTRIKMAEAAMETIARIKATIPPSEGLAREVWGIVEMRWVM
jgi:hypothetical protein